MIKSNSILNFVLILSLIAGVFLRLYNINHDNLWIDEMATFWVTDPSISFKEMLDRHSATELAPQFYYILIYCHHSYENKQIIKNNIYDRLCNRSIDCNKRNI